MGVCCDFLWRLLCVCVCFMFCCAVGFFVGFFIYFCWLCFCLFFFIFWCLRCFVGAVFVVEALGVSFWVAGRYGGVRFLSGLVIFAYLRVCLYLRFPSILGFLTFINLSF